MIHPALVPASDGRNQRQTTGLSFLSLTYNEESRVLTLTFFGQHEMATPRLVFILIGLAGSALLGLNPVNADVRLPAVFSNHAVLQRDRPLPVWGWADPGESIRVELGERRAETSADPNGRWQVTLAPQPVSKIPLTLRVTGNNTLEIHDLLMGDVWLCSGQSNMEFPLDACQESGDITSAHFPLIRHFAVEAHFAATPQADVRGTWQVCDPNQARGFSAVGFYFARRIHQETDIPIGLIRASVGGTHIECWMSQETLLTTPELEPFASQMRASLELYQRELRDALPSIEQWVAQSREAEQAGLPLPQPPNWPEFPFGERRFRPRCVTLHNGMIAPLVPFALRGVLWYQGEINAGSVADGEQYIAKKRALIHDWREWFGDTNLPFYFVQLAAWQTPTTDPALADGWAFFREAQRRCLDIPNTGMAMALDVGDSTDIHPRNKFDVGERLARWALAHQYGQALETSGPLFRALTIENHQARLQFDHIGSGLMVGGKHGRDPVTEVTDGRLQRFAIAGENRVWYWANAHIEGDEVVCHHPEVPHPVAIRYAFSMNPEGANLYNREGLPASPFRTDNW